MKAAKIISLIIALFVVSSALSGCTEADSFDSVKVQDFEVDFVWWSQNYRGYTIYDFDYELYDSQAEGNSAENVTGGRYSLHRKGTSKYFENSIIINSFNQIEPLNRYTLTMNVKLGKHFHSDGAIKVYSNNSATYPWAVVGNYIDIIPIKDLKENEWTKVSFTFEPSEAFLGIQTPGYVELFIDDIVLTSVDKKSLPLSKQPTYKEYTVVERTENGEIIRTAENFVDVTEIIDPKLSDNNKNFEFIIITAGGIVVISLVFLIFIIKRKKLEIKERTDEK